jgi:hypothetical protein
MCIDVMLKLLKQETQLEVVSQVFEDWPDLDQLNVTPPRFCRILAVEITPATDNDVRVRKLGAICNG